MTKYETWIGQRKKKKRLKKLAKYHEIYGWMSQGDNQISQGNEMKPK
jgi:hypothetical protein